MRPTVTSSSSSSPMTMLAIALGTVLLVVGCKWLRPQRDLLLPKEQEQETPASLDEKPPCDCLTDPAWRSRLGSLTTLSLAGCGLLTLPPEIGLCRSLKTLDLARNDDLETLPAELAELKQLDTLFVMGAKRMTRLPEVLGSMSSLTRLGLRSNGILKLEGARLPPKLVHLILTDNGLTDVDEEAYRRMGLVRKLMLANNRLTTFGGLDPEKNLKSLELLRLANNDLKEVPSALLKLPRLSWLALAGNPCVAPKAGETSIPRIELAEVSFEEGARPLGKGASGVVRAGSWRGVDVAVKTLQERSSDGRAVDELAVYAAFGNLDEQPRSVVRAVAICDHPAAVVMERLPASIRDLAKPPTIREVTRDVYPDSERFSARFVLAALSEVATALEYLHSKKVQHGDVYAHNILVDAETTKLGDFGASFGYSSLPDATAALLQRIEVRAFGVLTAELATRIADDDTAQLKLIAIADTCLSPKVSGRPSFAQLRAAPRIFVDDAK